jgi:8-oxo-dGTP pyrophosphatase MutT (NUDIX family)
VTAAREPGPAGHSGPVPAWLRELAAAAKTMEIPPILLPPADGGRASAVLVLFGDGMRGPDLLLIQRSEGLRLHAGQPAFPGGAVDAGDDGPVAAALREAAEEVGLDPRGVDVVGALPEVFIQRTGFRVVPVLGWWREPSAVAPVDAGEVAAVERVSLAELADPGARLMVRGPGGRTSPAFRVRGMLIWGFTAALVDRLLALGGWEKPWDVSTVADLPALGETRLAGLCARAVTGVPGLTGGRTLYR